jgi:HD-like signal output (HDOD) protein
LYVIIIIKQPERENPGWSLRPANGIDQFYPKLGLFFRPRVAVTPVESPIDSSPESLVAPQIAHRIQDIGRLVSLPQTTYTLLSLLMDEKTFPRDLQVVVEQDPALAAKVISLSNSSYYSLRRPVSTIERAINVIGFKELEFMAMGLGLSETFDLSQVPDGFDGQALWLHSLSVAWISRELALLTKAVDPSEAMITGLLHELGIIILVSKFPVQFQQIMELILAGMTFVEAESALGLRHDILGYLLAKNWGLPPVFQAGILYHHRPREAKEHGVITSMVALADSLAQKAGFELKLEEPALDLRYVLDKLILDVDTLQDFIKEMMIAIPRIEPVWLQMMRSGAKAVHGKSRFTSLIEQDQLSSYRR